LWKKGEDEKKAARVAIYPEEQKWVTTDQDARAALLVAPENGFRTSGTVTMVAEIPPGYHTGRHSHGEEAIWILEGSGYSIVNDQRFNWEERSCVRIPFGAVHQHFNSGTNPVKYYSVMAPYWEALALVAKFEQYEKFGKNIDSKEIPLPNTESGLDRNGRRIVMHANEASVFVGGEDRKRMPRGLVTPKMHEGTGHLDRLIGYMGSREDFVGDEVEITGLLCLRPHSVGGKHAHMEALLYVLQGEGYSVVNDVKYQWKPGTALHVQGPQTPHQHANTSDKESQLIRAHSAIRYNNFQKAAKGKFPYLILEHRPE
jgi:quercetin dioxygenase-like cupin family protein